MGAGDDAAEALHSRRGWHVSAASSPVRPRSQSRPAEQGAARCVRAARQLCNPRGRIPASQGRGGGAISAAGPGLRGLSVVLRNVARRRCILARDHIFRVEAYDLTEFIQANFIEDGNEEERVVGMFALCQSIRKGDITTGAGARASIGKMLGDDRVWFWALRPRSRCRDRRDDRRPDGECDRQRVEGSEYNRPRFHLPALCAHIAVRHSHGLMPIEDPWLDLRLPAEIDRALSSTEVAARVMAVEAAGYLDLPMGLPPVLRGLYDPRWNVRNMAIACLFKLGAHAGWSERFFSRRSGRSGSP